MSMKEAAWRIGQAVRSSKGLLVTFTDLCPSKNKSSERLRNMCQAADKLLKKEVMKDL